MPLDGSFAKLRRAEEHYRSLEAQARAFLFPNPYRIVVEKPADQLFVVRVVDPPTFPHEQLAVTIGDCVHNLRSALDYLAWELAGGNLGDTETQFPIFESEEGWKRRGLSRIRKLPVPAQELIESLQPFHSPEPRTKALNVLRILDDFDKHKLLTITVAQQNSLSFAFEGSPPHIPIQYTVNAIESAVLSHGAVLATIVTEAAPPEMYVRASFTPGIAFGENLGLGPRVAVLRNLALIVVDMQAMVAEFGRRFFGGSGGAV